MVCGSERLPGVLLQVAVSLLILSPFSSVKAEGLVEAEATQDKPAPDVPAVVEVFGKIVDDATGKPIDGFLVQAGKFDPKDPTKVTWGFSESRNSSSSSFQAQVRWKEGWTARIVADGYIPQPVLTEAPPAGKDRIEKVIRLKKGRVVRGRVLDHLGKPVKDASVFAARPSGMTLAGGRVVNSFDGEEDKSVRGVKTDAEGRFELSLTIAPEPGAPASKELAPKEPATTGKPAAFAISSSTLDAWPVPLQEGNEEQVIRLPAPTRVEIEFDIEGSDEEANVFVQSLMHGLESWKGFEVIRHIKVANKGRVTVLSLPPGRYQFARSRMLYHGNIGHGQLLDRKTVELVEGKSAEVSFVRKTGARLSGSVSWDPEIKLTGVILSVRKVISPDASPSERLFQEAIDARLLRAATEDRKEQAGDKEPEIVGNRGLFLTERLPAGTYELHVQGYTPITPEQMRFSGIIRPALTTQVKVTIPETGAVPSLKIKLEKAGGNDANQ